MAFAHASYPRALSGRLAVWCLYIRVGRGTNYSPGLIASPLLEPGVPWGPVEALEAWCPEAAPREPPSQTRDLRCDRLSIPFLLGDTVLTLAKAPSSLPFPSPHSPPGPPGAFPAGVSGVGGQSRKPLPQILGFLLPEST